MNISFSNPGCNSNFNFYNPDWSNQSDISWSAQTAGNYAPQFQELHHSNYPQFNHQAQPLAYQAPQLAPQSSLEEMMKACIYNQTALMQSTNKFIQSTEKFMQQTDQAIQSNNRDIQELKSYVARIEGQIGHLVTESNRIEEEEFQSPLIIERHYMSDEDEVVDNKEEQVEHNERIEYHEKSQPPTDPNLPSDIEVSTKAHACITAPLETHQEPKASSLECLQEPSYVKILKDLSTQAQKSRNHIPKKILRSKQFYIRCQNILLEGYEVLKKKG
jgi:hypothetical protein